ncbi:MAG TPA: hypothetical protein VLC09_18985 [Polyangiaceae bacterium]|nr:hypothetical protein [Polyangiaceae bacterium]
MKRASSRLSCRALGLLGLPSLLAASLTGCGSGTPTVPLGPQPAEVTGVPVPYPPPPAQVEVVPLRRRETCFWRDGSWDFRGGQWEWVKGGWMAEQHSCYFAPGETHFESTPTGVSLVFRRGSWFDNATGKPCEPPPACAEDSARLSRSGADLAQRSEPW